MNTQSGRIASALLALCLAFGSAAAEPLDASWLQGLGDSRYHRHTSERLGRDFHVYVRLPAGYADAPDARYPAVYLLDGGITFPLLAAYYHYLTLGEELPPLILVGISYGSDSFEQGNLRSTDFTAPSAERDYWGGAAAFQAMLAGELLPFVEAGYRADPARRIVFGQSLGGQFVLFTAQSASGPFWGHIASNPALHRNLDFFLQEAVSRPTAARLFVASADGDNPVFREPALAWFAHWQGVSEPPWALRAVTLGGHTHFSAAPQAFRDGLAWLFAP